MIRTLALLVLCACAGWGQQRDQFEQSVRSAMAASLERQRVSIQQQASSALNAPAAPAGSGFFAVPWPEPIQTVSLNRSAPDCPAMPKGELDVLIRAASGREGVDANLIEAVIGKESAAKPCAVSPKGAQGLMQLMPSTADQLGVRDPFDPRENVEGGARLLKQLLTKYGGDVALALGAYNAGAGRVDREGGVPNIPETVNYVSDILSRFRPQ